MDKLQGDLIYSTSNSLKFDKKIGAFLSSYFVLFILVISQFKPQSIIGLAEYRGGIFNPIDKLWIIAQIISFVVLSILYLRKFKVHSFNIFFLISMFHITMVSYLNGTPISRIASIIIPPISILFMIELAYRYKVFDKVILTFYSYFGGLILLNYISMIIFPDSLYTDYRGANVAWIFGNYQQNLNWFIIFIAISYYAQKIIGEKLKYINIFAYIIIILTTIKVWSATTIVALGIVFGLIIFENYVKIYEFINPLFTYLSGIIVTVLIAVYEIQQYFAFFIEDILQKRVDFTGRMRLWTNTINYIIEKPIWGQGIELSNVTFDKIGKTTSHNHYLNLVYNGGFLYLFLTIILVYLVAVKLKDFRKDTAVIYMNSAITGYYVYYLAEAKINLNIFILLLTIVYYYSIIKQEEQYEQVTRIRI